MTVLLQVSDTHFGTERPAVVKALVRLARTQAPDVVVLSGDVHYAFTSTASFAVFDAAFVRGAAAGDRALAHDGDPCPGFTAGAGFVGIAVALGPIAAAAA